MRELDLTGYDPVQVRYIQLLVESGQRAMAHTVLFGKDYLWMLDPDSGTWYLERLPEA